MKYAHILNYVASTPWAIHPDKMREIVGILAYRSAGHTFTAEEIQARIGDPSPAAPAKQGNVAVVPLRGVIAHRMGGMDEMSGGMSTERFMGMLRQAAADDTVGTIVLDCDSPGGTITGVPEAAQAVFDLRGQKRVVAVANGMMASAAYWIGSQATELVAIPSIYDGFIGSIGVFTVLQDLSEALANEGVKATIIRAGKYKFEGNPFEPPTEELVARIQGNVDAAYARMCKDIARGRGVTPAAIRDGFGEGRALNAAESKAVGLVDRIATMDDTITRLLGRGAAAGGALRGEGDAPVLTAEEVAIEVQAGQPTTLDRARRLLW